MEYVLLIIAAICILLTFNREGEELDYRSEIGRLLAERYCQYSANEKLSTWSFKLIDSNEPNERSIFICTERGGFIIKTYDKDGKWICSSYHKYEDEPRSEIDNINSERDGGLR